MNGVDVDWTKLNTTGGTTSGTTKTNKGSTYKFNDANYVYGYGTTD